MSAPECHCQASETQPTREVQEERIVGLGIRHEPAHGVDDVLLGRLHHGVGLVVGQDDHILALVPMVLDQVLRKVLGVVDAAAQFAFLAEIVDTDQERTPLSCAVGVLEGIAGGGSVAELLVARRRRRAGPRRLPTVSAISTTGSWVAVGIEMRRGRMLRRLVVLLLLRRLVSAVLLLVASLLISSLLVPVLLISAVLRRRLAVALLVVLRRRLAVTLLRRGILSITLRSGTLLISAAAASAGTVTLAGITSVRHVLFLEILQRGERTGKGQRQLGQFQREISGRKAREKLFWEFAS